MQSLLYVLQLLNLNSSLILAERLNLALYLWFVCLIKHLMFYIGCVLYTVYQFYYINPFIASNCYPPISYLDIFFSLFFYLISSSCFRLKHTNSYRIFYYHVYALFFLSKQLVNQMLPFTMYFVYY